MTNSASTNDTFTGVGTIDCSKETELHSIISTEIGRLIKTKKDHSPHYDNNCNKTNY